ncbi:circadian clock protein KaiC [Aromatoleum buckelii]|uniref:non-specific serine/threonine protein kinase n=1 Tax=Aromatoleum buckelii TaxID=200254 RepID=A0ABX1N5C2_9RHOO|nr:circadian clock protein KaiC [Aromatoleum buckelii]MCK0511693.1 circadian clock protein KaiC [Aromatoleum buckelii]
MRNYSDIDPAPLEKAPTGIDGFDDITRGGLPRGRPTLVCGSAGCGKTLFGMEFLARGAAEFDEPGVFVAFEETPDELIRNAASVGFDLAALSAQGKLAIEHIYLERSEIEETGEYDLEALFIRLGYAVDQVGAKRIVLDTLEALFAALPNEFILRAELRRLFRWLKQRGLTAVITGERGAGTLTRHGLEEYVSDCVILLDVRMAEQVATRRLRIVKYRGSSHGSNEYPFLIDRGFTVLPITSVGLEHEASDERISTGIAQLDAMLEGKGLYRGSSVLLSGTAGSGKSSIAAHFAQASCARGERCLYFAFEESQQQILRNMRSIGVDLAACLEGGLLAFHNARPTQLGLEMHLALMYKTIRTFRPRMVIVDPISNFMSLGTQIEVRAMFTRLVDYLKTEGITAVFTSLTSGSAIDNLERTETEISSIIDAWLLLRDIETDGERNRAMYILKSRGMAHSNQIREFVLSERGIDLIEVYTGPEGVLTGSARLAREAQTREAQLDRTAQLELTRVRLEHKRHAIEAQVAALHAELAAEAAAFDTALKAEQGRDARFSEDRDRMATQRKKGPFAARQGKGE